ncbi:MAG: type 4a pilus biogenesis protein PilO [Mariprofundales bacterium]|nr:type 4a pilus biogenesis protein PilO [Mariprofundales bacterium]
MNLSQINLAPLDPLRPILPLPLWQKTLLLLMLVVVLPIGGYGWLVWQGMLDQIEVEKKNIAQQKVVLRKNRKLAADLPRKQKEYAQLELQLRVALNLLPKKAEISDLLESVSWAGKDSGLEFTKFKPLGEKAKGLYADVPVSLQMVGSYKQLIQFMKRVGEMPRIVNVNSLSIAAKGKDSMLQISGMATTYRFLEQDRE